MGLRKGEVLGRGSLLAALEVHPRVAMRILRHSKIAVTMEIYAEVPSAATRDALKRLGQWLGSQDVAVLPCLRAVKKAGYKIATGLWPGWAILGSNQ